MAEGNEVLSGVAINPLLHGVHCSYAHYSHPVLNIPHRLTMLSETSAGGRMKRHGSGVAQRTGELSFSMT